MKRLRETREYLLKMEYFQSISARLYFESFEISIDLSSTVLRVYP